MPKYVLSLNIGSNKNTLEALQRPGFYFSIWLKNPDARGGKILISWDFLSIETLEEFDMFQKVRPFLVMYCSIYGVNVNSEEGGVLRFKVDDDWVYIPFEDRGVWGWHYDYKLFVSMLKEKYKDA